ncbi:MULTISPECIES: DUF4132 domain-containing protein [Kitasatospora]|uniref:WGR domain-containing protein n=1 Tax=Kitasatospora setae (strain ATCC 33774 / DSM 43861 / JCM 3304 / KCC A-0304 / NBRC 14216 / KM-6054) TaxID=452652 RepID=E4N447_KITSK|nr:DUF4132 domain-containing protein [Kitasatospora setae]BAJ25978.1 hypothetical protein KSE_01270 [Kitasatospora setae KM-6054]
MRRWEFTEDGSDKFWEAGTEGTALTVRYGRRGTAGRARVREFASAADAAAHLAKAAAEKERKGYREVGGQAPAETPSGGTDTVDASNASDAVDEDVFVLPDGWRRLLVPRRGGASRPPAAPVKGAVERLRAGVGERRAWIDEALADPRSDGPSVAAARAYLAGAADPLGAAAVAALAGLGGERATADAWVAGHGLVFAAVAAVELMEVEVSWRSSGSTRRQGPVLSAGQSSYRSDRLAVAGRVRALLAACPEPLYREAVGALGAVRTAPSREVVAAYLVPTEREWVDACCRRPGAGRRGGTRQAMLLCALSAPEQVAALAEPARVEWSAALVATVADGLGAAAAPLLLQGVEGAYDGVERRRLFDALALLPSDEGFRGLLAHRADPAARQALPAAMANRPRRALRLLAEAVAEARASQAPARTGRTRPDDPVPALLALLAAHAAAHRAAALELLPSLPPAPAAVLAPLTEPGDRLPDASAAELPAVLADPPWARERVAAGARVVPGVAAPAGCEVRWLPGEERAWAAAPADAYRVWEYRDDWAVAADWFRQGRLHAYQEFTLLLRAPHEVARPLLADWSGAEYLGDGAAALRLLVVRHGADALAPVLRAVREDPAGLGGVLLPLLGVEVARCAADWLVRLKSAGATARSWFARHGVAAARLLVPDAVGRAGAARRGAEQALRLVAAAHGAAAVRAAASGYGAGAAEAVDALLSADPLVNALPARLPVLEGWADPAGLPQLPLAGGGAALPVAAAGHLVMMLALSRPGEPYPGLAGVVPRCDPAGLAEFAWALFERWRLAGLPASGAWALHALGPLGDDGTVRRLSPVLRAWPGEGAHHRAVDGLEVLAAIGTETALRHLHLIAQRVPFKALKARAGERIAEVAAGLGLTGEQLADRLVPDFGLDAAGTAVVDYGPRAFTVGFDEQLRPFVRDGSGRRRAELPAPGAADDAGLAAAGRARYAELRKEVRATAADQVRRLEAAMVARRSWPAAEFTGLLVAHPLLRHLVRRLVWLAETAAAGGGGSAGGGGAVTAFRVAEDATFADVADRAYALPADAVVRVAHPVLLGAAELAAWAELFADYEVLQPFRQLGRPVHALTDQERAGHRLARFEGGPAVPTGRFRALARRGWEIGDPGDNGVSRWVSRPVGDAGHLVVVPEHGIPVAGSDAYPEQSVREVRLVARPGDHRRDGEPGPVLAALDPLLASELLADLVELTVP